MELGFPMAFPHLVYVWVFPKKPHDPRLQGQGHDHSLQQIGSALQDLWLHSEAVLNTTGTGEAGLPGDSWRQPWVVDGSGTGY